MPLMNRGGFVMDRGQKKIGFFLSLAIAFFSGTAYGQSDNFVTGEKLFKENRVEECVPFLKNAINEGGSPKAYLYLSLAYYQLEMYQESLDVCSDGMKVSGTDKKILAFNAGNTCFAMGDYYTAERWYSLAIAANRLYAPPVLNRANAELKQEKYSQSLADYKLYLDLSPNDRQKPEIEQIIILLEGWEKNQQAKLAEEQRLKEEEARILAEQNRLLMEDQKAASLKAEQEAREAAYNAKLAENAALMEQQRQAFEKMLEDQKRSQEENCRRAEDDARRRAEEDAARRRKLLEDVAASLQDSETSNMNAGAEGTVDYGYESELE